jgi:hypothetical protein
MKCPLFVLGLVVCSATASAQQTAMVQMQCRDLASTGNFVNSDEVLINGMACHTAKQAPPPTHLATSATSSPGARVAGPIKPIRIFGRVDPAGDAPNRKSHR